jgi:voltage-gated potassium channel
MDKAAKAVAQERFERHTAVPMLILSLAIIPLLLIPLLVDLPSGTESTLIAIDWFIWAVFFIEYGIRLYLAPRKAKFIASNKIDLVVIVLPFLRPLRVFQSVRAARVLRAARGVAVLLRAIDAARDVLTRHKLHYVLTVTLVSVVTGALMVEAFERDAPDSNIHSIPDAIWWATTTVTTVGYGDRFPVTAGGRAVATVLMILGIALFGLLAGSLASFFFERQEEQKIDPQLKEINDRLEHIEAMLGSKEEHTLANREHT